MPNNVVKSYAKKTKKSTKKVEGKWQSCKHSVKGNPKDGSYWAKVNKCTQNKLGIKKESNFDKITNSILKD